MKQINHNIKGFVWVLGFIIVVTLLVLLT